jgi:hypothetical protein
MPKKPISPDEEPEFRQSMGALYYLVMSSTLVAVKD